LPCENHGVTTVKKVKLLGEHEEELSQKIVELEALCKKLRKDT
jgi:hypothetical protein